MMLYSDEVWTGIEYQVAGHMLYESLTEQGLAIVKAARDRYDGAPRPPIQRNPWNEIECGGHYARAMSSWSLLLALSGWLDDGPRQRLRFVPRHVPEKFKSFFAGPEGWGSVGQSRQATTQINELSVREGQFPIAELALELLAAPRLVQVACAGKPIEHTFMFEAGGLSISFRKPLVVKRGQALTVRVS